MPPPLQRLVQRLDAAVATNALPGAVTAALGEAVGANNWLSPEQQRASHDHYTRHVLHADPQDRYTVVAIVWGRGQQSPIHGHHTWCSVALYSGEISETFYDTEGPGGTPRALRTIQRGVGTLSFDADLTGAHRIANTACDVAVSIHVYGVGAAHVTTGVNRILG